MLKIAKPLQEVIDAFERLPGIGPKTAQRLGYYLLHVPQPQLEEFARALENLKKNTVLCSICKNVSESSPCPICSNENRASELILVVEHPLDVLAFEKTRKYSGVYHVLHGSINPLENIGPDELYIEDLFKRIRESNGSPIKEIIIATNPTMEGESTAMYIKKEIEDNLANKNIKLTRLGMGVPSGAYLEFADENTLSQAFEGRRSLL